MIRRAHAQKFFRVAAHLILLAALQSPRSLLAETQDLTTFSIEELMNMEVTSVSKTPEKHFQAPAAIYILTSEDIRRSGVTSLPEALRLVPGVEVLRINSNQWSVGIRGFGSGLSRYTLVLVDGRSVYTPLFAGTYWEAQDTVLEDIDRIEVIRGPGGSLWGSNAVNGVINIITKHAKETLGGLVKAGGGTEERAFGTARYGGARGEDFAYRFYGKYTDRGASYSKAGEPFDDWQKGQGGFRADWNLGGGSAFTLQGDVVDAEAGVRNTIYSSTTPVNRIVTANSYFFGANILGRWTRKSGENSHMALQFYYDRTTRNDPKLEQSLDTFDVDFQHTLPLFAGQAFTYGTAYRLYTDDTEGLYNFRFTPTGQTQGVFSIFLQDQIPLYPNRLILTLGVKSEKNNYTGWENQPSGRLAWTPTERQTLWTAVSRSVRTPSRLDRDGNLTFISLPGLEGRFSPSPQFDSEKLLAYEAGYRVRPVDPVFFGVDGFYNQYDDLQSLNFGPLALETSPPPLRLIRPFYFENRVRGKIYGGELNAVWTPLPYCRFEGVYSLAKIALENKGGSADGVTVPSKEGATPRHQVVLRSSMDLPGNFQFDPTARYVSKLPSAGVPQYWTMDARLGWQATQTLDLSLVGQNLFQARHPESNENVNEIQRGVYLKATWMWR